ncbi:IS3 family transposase (plasmid) [Cupriavidus metallidurans]|uniref:IS3 family transposase n=1 Tax=Cupriavidus metallidurans TaxID=119219 RepID=A0A482J3R6_9BURK|nr:IS3 family transposase [Cupriavidus metallidurans]QBP14609.1 IS3 family transposase [Cupriavidus metallidurans]QBP14632.1 IS3 family transposase [Cupriavidus metallidurans]QBP14639.1 IS3 family transposase [Cupriavidus metallidurans]
MVMEHRDDYPSEWAAIESIAPKIGCVPQTLHGWVRRQQTDAGVIPGPTTEERQRIKDLERENRELRRANEILKLASAFFRPGGARPPHQELKRFVDTYRDRFGVEPICRVLQIAPSGYRRHAAQCRQPERLSARRRRDLVLMPEIQRVWEENMSCYGARKVWKQLRRERIYTARCTVARLMKQLKIEGIRRGKVVKTTIQDNKAVCPLDRVQRQFKADRPNQLWVSDFTYVSTWQGWLYVAFVIDVFARRIVGWRVSRRMTTDFVLDALEQALHARRFDRSGDLIHHSDRGSQYVSISYTERLAEAGIEPSVGSKGDSYDNALAETINGLYKTEVIHRQSWKSREAVEMATLDWVHWYNTKRLMEPLGDIPPAEAEANFYRQQAGQAMAA